jgi:hypothetical protein
VLVSAARNLLIGERQTAVVQVLLTTYSCERGHRPNLSWGLALKSKGTLMSMGQQQGSAAVIRTPDYDHTAKRLMTLVYHSGIRHREL